MQPEAKVEAAKKSEIVASQLQVPANAVTIEDLGDHVRVVVDLPVEPGDMPSRRRTLARAWEALAAAISETKAKLPPVPSVPRPTRKRPKRTKGTRTGSGSWWQF